ncbi:MAG: N-acetylmuramoyl-L-alanine amidase, partial [Nitrososphaera sp.]|nr:N-acetylmuramoyl-L-alanine amidase [Nitrososphaera sp.]
MDLDTSQMFRLDTTSFRLPPEEIYQTEFPKKQIYIHHTVGGSAKSTFNWWKMDRTQSGGVLKVGTAYLIERNGTIYEVFDPRFWCHHLGLKISANARLNQQSIGIELCSEGALTKKEDGKLYAFDGARQQHDKSVELPAEWRGYKYFDAYEDIQLEACFWLVGYLCNRFNIPRLVVPGPDRFVMNSLHLDFPGVLGHCNVRSDKTD